MTLKLQLSNRFLMQTDYYVSIIRDEFNASSATHIYRIQKGYMQLRVTTP